MPACTSCNKTGKATKINTKQNNNKNNNLEEGIKTIYS